LPIILESDNKNERQFLHDFILHSNDKKQT
jgi:hypothetical protein